MKIKNILIGAGIASALFLVYWFFIRKSKPAGPSEIEELEKTFKSGNPFAANAAEPLNNTYNVSESSPQPPLKANWLPSGGGQPREQISKQQFDAKVYTTIKQIIAEAKAGRPEWLNSIKEQMLQSWRPISLSGNNTSLAAAVAYEARYYTAAAYYHPGTGASTGGAPAGGGPAAAAPPAVVMYTGREFTPTNIPYIYVNVSSSIGTAFLDTNSMSIMTVREAAAAGVKGWGIS